MDNPVISTYEAPRDFPSKLPSRPPTENEIYQLLEIWDNVTNINSLRAEDWKGHKRSEYMLWTTDAGRQFRVIWNDDEGVFCVKERTKPL
jgi:hypothetical protein